MQAHIQRRLSTVERLRSYRLEQRSGATGEGSDYGKNGRATSEGAESGVSGGRKQFNTKSDRLDNYPLDSHINSLKS